MLWRYHAGRGIYIDIMTPDKTADLGVHPQGLVRGRSRQDVHWGECK